MSMQAVWRQNNRIAIAALLALLLAGEEGTQALGESHPQVVLRDGCSREISSVRLTSPRLFWEFRMRLRQWATCAGAPPATRELAGRAPGY